MPASRLKELIAASAILAMPGVFDGFSARLVERMGFEAAFVTGAGLSESRLGVPDVGVMGFTESLEGAAMIASRTSLVLLADGDTGYGNAVNVHVAVQRFEQAGLSGLMLEDQVMPKKCGHLEGKSVIRAEEMVEKVKAAIEARRDPGFVIEARTDSAATHGLDEAIRRACMYARAGADLVFADALSSEEDIRRFVGEVDAPVAVNMGFGLRNRNTTPLIPAKVLERMGVAVVIYPRLLTTAAVQGMKNALEAMVVNLGAEVNVERTDLQVTFEELNDMMGLAEFEALEDRHSI